MEPTKTKQAGPVETDEDEDTTLDLADHVNAFGQEQHSVVTRRQLRSVGRTDDEVDQELSAGRLLREGPGAFRPWGVKRNWKMRASAAVLSARAPALISHRSAAWLYGIDEHQPGIIDITVPRHRRPRSRPGVQFHESRQFDVATATAAVRDGLPVTGIARTILDSCSALPGLAERLDLFDEARRLKLVDWDELWDCLMVHTGRGRPGLQRYRDVLLTRDGTAPAGTKFARRVGVLLEAAGLPAPVYEYPVQHPEGEYFIDLAYLTPRRVAVECIGRIGHDFERAFEADPVRRNYLQLQGWLVLEITWRRFIDSPGSVVAEIREALTA
ncbi:MAG TPA: type IV toxin-antitoxin system AbiEi family antitoxin [Acidimicrobiia bacterium]|nr:type IV toxin-antitoxin system AbiEi family antitoxin [Acidimicrobiia bacterium]